MEKFRSDGERGGGAKTIVLIDSPNCDNLFEDRVTMGTLANSACIVNTNRKSAYDAFLQSNNFLSLFVGIKDERCAVVN